MAWLTKDRGPKGGYYYRSRRIGGRVIKEYLGRGAAARTSAELDRLRALDRRLERSALGAWEAELDGATAPLLELCRLADLVSHAALLAAGYYRHHGGEWRRRGRSARTQ